MFAKILTTAHLHIAIYFFFNELIKMKFPHKARIYMRASLTRRDEIHDTRTK